MLKLNDPGLLADRCLIGGEWCAADDGATLAVTNPATGAVLARVPKMGRAETRRALEAADGRACRADLAEVEAHAAAPLADLGKRVEAAVDALERVRHRVDEAARELVIGLPGIGERRRRHRDLLHAAGRYWTCSMQCDHDSS